MDHDQRLADQFEEHRPRLEAVAYRMLGSLGEAQDAVQETWLRLDATRAGEIANLPGWLTTVSGRICLDKLRSRRSRREQPLAEERTPADGPRAAAGDPEAEAVLADAVGRALLIVLETLDPAERLAFVLHDMFAVPFGDIARVVDRTPAAARKLASRARRRVRGARGPLSTDQVRQRRVVEAFLEAARGGDFDALVAVLDPDVVARTDGGSVGPIVRGAAAVAGGAIAVAAVAGVARLVLVDGGVAVLAGGGALPARVLTFAVAGGRVTELDVVTDPDLLARLDLAALPD